MTEEFWKSFDTCFTEHLGGILNKDNQYRKAVAREKDLFERFRDSLTEVQKGQLDECYSAICDSSAVAEKIAYRRGAKDLLVYLFLDR